jgi:hypothetical protein
MIRIQGNCLNPCKVFVLKHFLIIFLGDGKEAERGREKQQKKEGGAQREISTP